MPRINREEDSVIQLQVSTHDHEEMLDLTPAVRKAIRENGGSDGAFTTGAVTVKKTSAYCPK